MENPTMIAETLIKKDIRPSYIRIRIYEYLYRNRIHPNVDTIYRDLLDEIPTLSKTTVYNTLKLLMDKELVRGVNVFDNEMRYEAIRNDHGHFKCNKCNSIYDIPIDIEIKFPLNMQGAEIDEKHLLITGICNKCSSL